MNPAGNAHGIYSTYLGGAANDASGSGIAVDSSGNAYVAGYTYSLNFPTLDAYQTSNRGPQNAFITKLSPSGSLIYSTYLGGNGNDSAAAIAVDAAGSVYITGGTTSTNFPTAAPLQAVTGGNQDAFVSKLNAAGNGLVYTSTYLGGSGGMAGSMEAGTGIALDATGDAYVTGVTSSTNFPVTPGVLQPTNMGAGRSPSVARLRSAGSALVYSTYLGGSSVDYASGIAPSIFSATPASPAIPLAPRLLEPERPATRKRRPLRRLPLHQLNPGRDPDLFSALTWAALAWMPAMPSPSIRSAAFSLRGLHSPTDFPLKNPFQPVNGGSYGGFVSKISPGWVAGVFVNGAWYIDRNRNGGFDGTAAGDQSLTFGQPQGDIPRGWRLDRLRNRQAWRLSQWAVVARL